MVSTIGTGSVDWDIAETEHGEPDQVFADFFLPKFFQPHLNIFNIPAACPSDVAEALRESFSLVFANPSAASNSVRIAVEHLLTNLKIRRFDVVNGKKRYINLHRRIALLPAKYAEHKDLLVAIKWLGNAGSHATDAISLDDVLDAYELTQHILEEIYNTKTKTLKTLAKKVNKKKGPVK